MKNFNMDQGTIIYGIRSDKYPENNCYGIVITASCDIANEKTSKIYYIVGLDIDEWFKTDHGFKQTYDSYVNNIRENLYEQLLKYKLDMDILLSFSYDEIVKTLFEFVKKEKDRKCIEEKMKLFLDFKAAKNVGDREKLIKSNPSSIREWLKRVNKGETVHYYYLPQDAYIDNKIMNKGLLVDLQEIGCITLEDAKKINSPGIDYLLLSSLNECDLDKYTKSFWLNCKDDFVSIDKNIKSPWREHLMQRFSHGFVRIGLDGATITDIDNIRDRIAGGKK